MQRSKSPLSYRTNNGSHMWHTQSLARWNNSRDNYNWHERRLRWNPSKSTILQATITRWPEIVVQWVKTFMSNRCTNPLGPIKDRATPNSLWSSTRTTDIFDLFSPVCRTSSLSFTEAPWICRCCSVLPDGWNSRWGTLQTPVPTKPYARVGERKWHLFQRTKNRAAKLSSQKEIDWVVYTYERDRNQDKGLHKMAWNFSW